MPPKNARRAPGPRCSVSSRTAKADEPYHDLECRFTRLPARGTEALRACAAESRARRPREPPKLDPQPARRNQAPFSFTLPTPSPGVGGLAVREHGDQTRRAAEEALGKKKAWRRPTLPPHDKAVPSALEGLTSVFGMGTGGTPPLWSPGNCIYAVEGRARGRGGGRGRRRGG